MVRTTHSGQNTDKFLPKKYQNWVKINKITHVLENLIKFQNNELLYIFCKTLPVARITTNNYRYKVLNTLVFLYHRKLRPSTTSIF